MSESKSTRFQFKFAGVEIEIDGEPDFVNHMYRKILADVESVRSQNRVTLDPFNDQTDDSLGKKIIWIHKCTQMMNKIYMSTAQDLANQSVLSGLDLDGLDVIYCDRESIKSVLPSQEEGQTLWAELTSQGKLKIAHTQRKKG